MKFLSHRQETGSAATFVQMFEQIFVNNHKYLQLQCLWSEIFVKIFEQIFVQIFVLTHICSNVCEYSQIFLQRCVKPLISANICDNQKYLFKL